MTRTSTTNGADSGESTSIPALETAVESKPFDGAIEQIIEFYPKAIVGLIGYFMTFAIVGGIAFGGIVVLTSTVHDILSVVIQSVAGGVLYVTVFAVFWTATFTNLNRIYHGLPTGEVVLETSRKLGRVVGVLGLQIVVFLTFVGLGSTAIAVSGGEFWAMGGAFLCLLTGYAFYLLFHVAEFAVIDENTGVIESMRRSLELVKEGRTGFNISILVLTGWFKGAVALVPLITMFMGMGLMEPGNFDGSRNWAFVFTVGILFVSGAVFSILAVANYVVFRSLVARHKSEQGW